jgi:hypothetical protein
MKRLATFITAISNKISDSFALRMAYYAAIIALLLIMYIISDGESISFVYNEF